MAEKIGIEGREDLYIMFDLGGLIRTIDVESSTEGSSRLEKIREESLEKLKEYDKHLHTTYKVTQHPIRNLVGMGISSLLYAADYSKKRTLIQ
jgi:hypothetical protein